MKKLLTVFVVLFVVLSCSNGSEKFTPPGNGGTTPPPATTVVAHKRAKEVFDLVTGKYAIANTGLYKENYPAQSGDPQFSFLWPYVGITSASATLAQLGYNTGYKNTIENFEKYYRSGANGNSIGGYGSTTNGTTGGGTRFYDDNAIVGISLLEANKIAPDANYMTRCKKIVQFLKSGIDDTFGGGMWWNEDEKHITGNVNSNKPTCSNGFAALFLLEYYNVCDATEKQDVLETAKKLYAWLRNNLYDASTKCYWNDKNASGAINYTIWTYNTGMMIQNGIRLYKITGDKKYLDEAIASATGAYDYFVKLRNGVLSYPDYDPWFNTKLLRAYIDLAPYFQAAETYINAYFNFINNGYDKARTNEKFFYEDWTGASPKRYYSLLMQAAVIESYGAIALYKKESIAGN